MTEQRLVEMMLGKVWMRAKQVSELGSLMLNNSFTYWVKFKLQCCCKGSNISDAHASVALILYSVFCVYNCLYLS